MTTAICFDLDGTLVRFQRPYEELLRELFAAELGGGEDPGRLADVYSETFFEAFGALADDPVETAMAAVLDDASGDVEGDPAGLAAALLEAEQAATAVPAGTHESLAALSASNRLAVVTNGVPGWQRAKLAHHDLLEQFETVVASYEVGAHKPDAAPFAAVRERIDADRYVMVGDDYEADVEGARAAGFVPVHVEDTDGPDFWATLRAMV